jgi:hypothetical protein
LGNSWSEEFIEMIPAFEGIDTRTRPGECSPKAGNKPFCCKQLTLAAV